VVRGRAQDVEKTNHQSPESESEPILCQSVTGQVKFYSKVGKAQVKVESSSNEDMWNLWFGLEPQLGARRMTMHVTAWIHMFIDQSHFESVLSNW
jgi:hypothetical protein